MSRIEVEIVDSELINFGEEMEKFLTFDLTTPHTIEGEVGLHGGKLYIIMSNGDSLELNYKVSQVWQPNSKDVWILTINNRLSVDLGVPQDHPGEDVRAVYKNYLEYIITHKKVPWSVNKGLVFS